MCLQHTSTASEGGHTIHDTTYEVDYAAIILQRAMKWFMKGVADLDNQDVHFPDQSHGFSTVLANVHRAHPRISTSCGFQQCLLRYIKCSAIPSTCLPLIACKVQRGR